MGDDFCPKQRHQGFFVIVYLRKDCWHAGFAAAMSSQFPKRKRNATIIHNSSVRNSKYILLCCVGIILVRTCMLLFVRKSGINWDSEPKVDAMSTYPTYPTYPVEFVFWILSSEKNCAHLVWLVWPLCVVYVAKRVAVRTQNIHMRVTRVCLLCDTYDFSLLEKVVSSPYLRNYRSFATRRLASGVTRAGEVGVIDDASEADDAKKTEREGRLGDRHVASDPHAGEEEPGTIEPDRKEGDGEEDDEMKNNQCIGDLQGQSNEEVFMEQQTNLTKLMNVDSFLLDNSPLLPRRLNAAELCYNPLKPARNEADELRYVDGYSSPPKTVPLVKKSGRRRANTKPDRTGSFASGLQRMMMSRERRRGSLDEREIARLKNAASKSIDAGIFHSRPGSFVSESEDVSAPRLCFEARRNSAIDCNEQDLPKNLVKRTKKRRFKEFFKAMSLNNVRDVRDGQPCEENGGFCHCQQTCVCSQQPPGHLSMEAINAIKADRDHMQYERDRAIEEWTEASSKWEIILDEMDSLLVELAEARKERDERKAEINDIIEKYEDELARQEDHFEHLTISSAEMEAQLTVAKKERFDALAEYDDLLKRSYDMKQDLDTINEENLKLHNHTQVDENVIASLRQQVENLQQERDHALQLWNSSVKERKKLHEEMENLIQSRDASLKKAFLQAEQLNKMRESHDALQREVSHGNLTSLERPKSMHCTCDYKRNGVNQDLGIEHLDDNEEENLEPEFMEFAVSLDRLDTKYGIKVDIAADEPNVIIVQVGAHVSSKNDIRVYDRILSINSTSVYRSDKKTVEKLLKDCSGRLTMVLRRESHNRSMKDRIKDVDITLPKSSGKTQNRSHHSGFGFRCKMEIQNIDKESCIPGAENFDAGDEILNINTQDINKVLEVVLHKLAKRTNGHISLRLKKASKGSIQTSEAQKALLLSPQQSNPKTKSLSDVSESSILSNASFTSEDTALTVDDNNSLFSGSIAMSTIYHFGEEAHDEDDDIMSLPERLRKLSNPFCGELDSQKVNSNGHHTHNAPPQSANGQSLASDVTASSERLSLKKSSETRSFRSLKSSYATRGPKQPLRRARSDAVDRKGAEPFSPRRVKMASNPSISGKSLQDSSEKSETTSWIMPSPELGRKTAPSQENNAINIFATLPRQKKKSVNDADCNKRTTHRVLRLEKISNEQLGFKICGGNKVGIFVKEIQEGSMAALGGMKVNSFDLNGATLDFATRVILKSEKLTDFRIEVKYEEKFKEIMKVTPRDSLYVRAKRSWIMEEDRQLKFSVGEVLHITNTVANLGADNRTSWQWYAEKVSKKAAGEAGFVPRLESFIEQSDPELALDDDVDSSRLSASEKRKRRLSAFDVKNWLLRKPSLRKSKKEKDKKINELAHGDKKDEIILKKGDFKQHYDVKEEVGRGKFGVVHKVVNKRNNAVHAAKFIKIPQCKREDVLHEVDIMRKLSHENLVNLVDVYDIENRIILIMEFISGGELFERIVEEDCLTEAEAAVYMKQILEGLQHMHSKNIIHLDLKPENIVCIEPKSTRIKLIDFGLARQLDPKKETKITCGTPEFVAPEVLSFDPVTLASDMWSVGVIAYILLSGLSPFLGDTDSETFANVSSCEWDFDDESFEEVSDESKHFIEGLIDSLPSNRRNVSDCLQHDWIKNYNCNNSKKLRVDNLRKFLAKKRWQRSVNAVRAIRRLSSFGAALLGKTKSDLRSKAISVCSDSPPSSISEETEAFETQTDDCVTEEDCKDNPDIERKKTDCSNKSKDYDQRLSPTPGLVELRKSFQSLAQAFKEGSSSITDYTTTGSKSTKDTVDKGIHSRGVCKDDDNRGFLNVEQQATDELRAGRDQNNKHHKGTASVEERLRKFKESDSNSISSALERKDPHSIIIDRKESSTATRDSSTTVSQVNGHLFSADKPIKSREKGDKNCGDLNNNTRVAEEGFSEDVSTKEGLRSYLQRMIDEGKLPGSQSTDYQSSPRPISWSCSSAAHKRASFADILAISAASEEMTESEDEEPIRVEVSKLKFDDYYEIHEEIGRGRFGVVNRVVEKATGKSFAAKHIKVRAATRDQVRQEIEILCSVRHKRIVQLHAVHEESRKFILVLELVGGGELFEKLSKEEQISEKEAVFFINQILHGVKSMHKNNVLHLDLKPENIMLVNENSAEIKIIDFGLAKKFDPNQDIKVLSGTPAFAAPEVINFEKITKATDIWSIGVIAYVLLSGISPFLGDDAQQTCSNVSSCQWDFDHPSFDKVSSAAKDFITKIIIKDPKKRMTVLECIEHPWIKNSRAEKTEIKTKPLFRFTRSFTQSFIDGDEEEFRPPLVRSQKVDIKRTHSNLKDISETKEDKSSLKNSDMMADLGGIALLEQRLKAMEAERDGMKLRLVRQTDLQTEIELMKCELEKSLDTHSKLQGEVLNYEQDKERLLEKSRIQGKEINRLEMKSEKLKQELDEKTENYESLTRKCKRLQERLERAEVLEEIVAELERDKKRKLEKINELEERIMDSNEMKFQRDKDDDKVRKKLEKNNKELQAENESCHQELEEMDERLSVLEKENLKLRKELKEAREEESDEETEELKEKINVLEDRIEDLEEKLAAELRSKQFIENERDSIEEEFEEERRNLEGKMEKIINLNIKLEEEKREIISLLEASKKSYFKLDEELMELKKTSRHENAAKEDLKKKDELINDITLEKDALKKDLDRLNNQMLALMEERQKLEEEAQCRDKGITVDRRQSAGSREIERIKTDLKTTQEYLRIATDTNTELQLEIKKLKTDHETELHIELIEQEARLTNANDQEIERVKEKMIETNNNERKELEDRITVQDFAIRKLQALLELREQEEDETRNRDATPTVVNGNASDTTSYSRQSSRNTVNVKITPGVSVSVSEDTDDEEADTLSERELRRLSYKISDGGWANMGQALGLRGDGYEDIMGSSYSDQEKIYQLLVLWKSEVNQPRCVLVSQLTVAIERMKRRDIVKFVRDLNTRDPGLSIRKRIKRFIK
eukprot:gene12034-13276_t